jgi:hypothetical protein
MCEFYVPLILLLSFNLIPVLIYYLAQLLGARSNEAYDDLHGMQKEILKAFV